MIIIITPSHTKTGHDNDKYYRVLDDECCGDVIHLNRSISSMHLARRLASSLSNVLAPLTGSFKNSILGVSNIEGLTDGAVLGKNDWLWRDVSKCMSDVTD